MTENSYSDDTKQAPLEIGMIFHGVLAYFAIALGMSICMFLLMGCFLYVTSSFQTSGLATHPTPSWRFYILIYGSGLLYFLAFIGSFVITGYVIGSITEERNQEYCKRVGINLALLFSIFLISSIAFIIPILLITPLVMLGGSLHEKQHRCDNLES